MAIPIRPLSTNAGSGCGIPPYNFGRRRGLDRANASDTETLLNTVVI
jgi:hypothetical protein